MWLNSTIGGCQLVDCWPRENRKGGKHINSENKEQHGSGFNWRGPCDGWYWLSAWQALESPWKRPLGLGRIILIKSVEEGRPILKVDGTIARAWVLDCVERRKLAKHRRSSSSLLCRRLSEQGRQTPTSPPPLSWWTSLELAVLPFSSCFHWYFITATKQIANPHLEDRNNFPNGSLLQASWLQEQSCCLS